MYKWENGYIKNGNSKSKSISYKIKKKHLHRIKKKKEMREEKVSEFKDKSVERIKSEENGGWNIEKKWTLPQFDM